MPILGFNINDILPPYTGPTGPGGAPDDMSPYEVSATEVVTTLSTTPDRQSILHGWLAHRAALRSLGFIRGFQWLDGSFVERRTRVTWTSLPTLPTARDRRRKRTGEARAGKPQCMSISVFAVVYFNIDVARRG
jgi:hypothetical protein